MADEIITASEVTRPLMRLFKITGLHPKENTKMGIFIYWVFCVTGIVYTIGSIIKCVQQRSLESFSVTYIDFLVASQTTTKGVALHLNKKRLSALMDTLWNDFWPLTKINENTEKYKLAYHQTIKYYKIYGSVLVCCIIQISLNALMLPFRALPYNIYFFGYENSILLQTPYYELLYVFECVTLSVAYILWLICHDMQYIALCGCATTQLDMLNHQLKRIGEVDEEESYKILKECVDHHNLLLKFLKEFDKVVTIPILKQYIDAISCMGIYIYLAQQNFHFLYVFSLFTNMSQTLFFSFFGQMIQDKSLAIADAAWDNKWHLVASRRIRQALILVQARAQRRTKISAGGFIFLSFESFVGMLKAAGSFLAVLRSKKD